MYWIALEPNSSARSKRPWPSAAIAHDASTTVCPCTARLTGPPGSDGATAMPMGRKREFISAAAPIAEPSPPPAPRMESAAICAEPAKTIADIITAAQPGIPTSRGEHAEGRGEQAARGRERRPGAHAGPEAGAHAAARARLRSVASSAHGRVFATCAGVSQARRAVAMP